MSDGRSPVRARAWPLLASALVALGATGERSLDLQGHRGARGLHPENTLEGFREALAIGVTTLEMDTGITSDGVVVVHHDEQLHPHVARGRDGKWLEEPTPVLKETRFEELASFDVGRLRPKSSYADRFPDQEGRDGVRIPRLPDVLRETERISGGRIHYNIETKLTPDAPERTASPEDFADALLAELRKAGIEKRTMVQSFDWRSLRHVNRVAPGIPTVCLTSEASDEDTIQRGRPGPSPWTAGLDVDGFDGSVPRLVKAAGCAVWSPGYRDVGAADVTLAQQLGLQVIPWTVNEPAAIAAMLDVGVDGIISDRPDRVRDALAKRGLPLPPRYAEAQSATAP